MTATLDEEVKKFEEGLATEQRHHDNYTICAPKGHAVRLCREALEKLHKAQDAANADNGRRWCADLAEITRLREALESKEQARLDLVAALDEAVEEAKELRADNLEWSHANESLAEEVRGLTQACDHAYSKEQSLRERLKAAEVEMCDLRDEILQLKNNPCCNGHIPTPIYTSLLAEVGTLEAEVRRLKEGRE